MQRRQHAPRRLKLDAIFDSKTFDETTLRQPAWLSDGVRFSLVDKYPDTDVDVLWIHDTRDGSRAPVMTPDALRLPGAEKPASLAGCVWSPDERCLLLFEKAPTRFSSCGNLLIFDIESGALRKLTDVDADQRHAKFSPDSSRIGLVRADDLWVLDLETGAEQRITEDASETRYNGRLGWVYEEELGLGDGWAWSPDGSRIAFLQQDEASVPEVLLSRYDDLHAAPRRTRYPKAGDPNPTVRAGIVDVRSNAIVWADLTDPGHGIPAGEHYIVALQWAPDGRGVLLQRIPRRQNRLDLLLLDTATAETRLIVTEADERWVDPAGKLHFVEGEDTFLWPSERSGDRQYYLYDLAGAPRGQVTQADGEADDIRALDSAARTLYYMAAAPRPVDRTLWAASLDGGETRPVLASEGRHTAVFAKDCARFLHTHSTVNAPATVAVRSTAGAATTVLVDIPCPALAEYGIRTNPSASASRSEWEFVSIETPTGERLWARILMPSKTPPRKGFPALIYTYGGPGSQVALDAWNGKRDLWHHMLAEMGYVVAMIDNRGTGGRGSDFRKQTFRRLGILESDDQIAAARFLGSHPLVDASRIGIWGWSYGGYMTCLTLARGGDVFRAGIAVAPVTDWTLYDTIYTERFMERPEDNPDGYRDGSPVTHAAGVKARLLIVHGTMDDNVHFQNSARLASALQDAKVQFEAMYYPGKHHGIEDRNHHLYTLMTAFLRRSL